ncbi:hypothetical protein TTHERM_00467920 (macronuclear) [Tetrahymena thermophila SB210]|uniref:Uncharacterized protein n=1 Tax=Tetrahymena thermophila (strain SB210) TaxID=312017 RepID=I7M438_TETTS|nr:hypothetical protein TTHERM_00467920 [Tetrahymena thermophila SB210]EAS04842.1 hypothetical protein TTHERM_00467920 [Tetrahymena thermophila SB210]|eukprot:XP_001025087.1 hypothetical protein TTHERM_00467920 [Tetrahymena thermophila SB210]
MNTLNSESSGSNLNNSKPSYYQDYLYQDEGLCNRGAANSHRFYSQKYQARFLDQSDDRTCDKINTSFYYDTKMQTIQQLQNQVEKLVEELRTQIHINKDILYENEKLQIKYRRLKQMVLEYIQNDETDTERIFNNYNTTLEKLVSQQQKLKEALINSEKKKYIDVNKLYDERKLEEQFLKIKQENTQLKQKLGRPRNDLNQDQMIDKYIKEERQRTPSKHKEKNKIQDAKNILSKLMNKENLDRLSKEISNQRYVGLDQNVHFFYNNDENMYKYREKSKEDTNRLNKSQNNSKNTPKKQKSKQDYQSNHPKGQVLQNLYSFGYRSHHSSSQNSEDQIDDLVNYNTKLNKNISQFPQKYQINDNYINKSVSQNQLKPHKNYHQ